MSGSEVDRLVAAARAARERAVAPYSGFKVGAALCTRDGRVYGGCNVENASYGLTVCAERVALLKALSEGERHFTSIAVVADTTAPTPPCGPCRQLLWEYCGDIPVVMANLTSIAATHHMRDLLPLPFGGELLEEGRGQRAPEGRGQRAPEGRGQRAEGTGRSKGRGTKGGRK